MPSKKILAFFVFIDGLGWKFAKQHDFLSDILVTMPGIRPVEAQRRHRDVTSGVGL